MTPPKPTARTTTPKPAKIQIDPDVAAFLLDVVFPNPESGRIGLQLNPADQGFDTLADLASRAKRQLRR